MQLTGVTGQSMLVRPAAVAGLRFGHTAKHQYAPFRSASKRARKVSKVRAGSTEPHEHSSSLTIDELTRLLHRVQKNEIDMPESRVWASKLGIDVGGDKAHLQARLIVAIRRRAGLLAPEQPELPVLPEHLSYNELASLLRDLWGVAPPPSTRAQSLELFLGLVVEEGWEASRSPGDLDLEPLDWEELTMQELKDELRLRHLRVTGTKSKLIARLRHWHDERDRARGRGNDVALVEVGDSDSVLEGTERPKPIVGLGSSSSLGAPSAARATGAQESKTVEAERGAPKTRVRVTLVLGGDTPERKEASLRAARWVVQHYPRTISPVHFTLAYVGSLRLPLGGLCLELREHELFSLDATQLDLWLDLGAYQMTRLRREGAKIQRRPTPRHAVPLQTVLWNSHAVIRLGSWVADDILARKAKRQDNTSTHSSRFLDRELTRQPGTLASRLQSLGIEPEFTTMRLDQSCSSRWQAAEQLDDVAEYAELVNWLQGLGESHPETARLAVRVERAGSVLGADVVSGVAAALLAAAKLVDEAHPVKTDKLQAPLDGAVKSICEPVVVIELVRMQATHFAVSVVPPQRHNNQGGGLMGHRNDDNGQPTTSSSSGTSRPVALPVTELAYYDLMEDVVDSDLAVERHRAICAGEDPDAATAVVDAMSRESRAPPLYLGDRPVRDTQEVRRFTPPLYRGQTTVLTPAVQETVRQAAIRLYEELGLAGPATFRGSIVVRQDEETEEEGEDSAAGNLGLTGDEGSITVVDQQSTNNNQSRPGPRRFEELDKFAEEARGPPFPLTPADPSALPPPHRVLSATELRSAALTPQETKKKLADYKAAMTGPSRARYGEWGGTEIDDRTREQILETWPAGVFAGEESKHVLEWDEEERKRRQLPIVAENITDGHRHMSAAELSRAIEVHGESTEAGGNSSYSLRTGRVVWSKLTVEPSELLCGSDSVFLQQAAAAGLDWHKCLLAQLLEKAPKPTPELLRRLSPSPEAEKFSLIDDAVEKGRPRFLSQLPGGFEKAVRVISSSEGSEMEPVSQESTGNSEFEDAEALTATAAVQLAERTSRYSGALPLEERAFLTGMEERMQSIILGSKDEHKANSQEFISRQASRSEVSGQQQQQEQSPPTLENEHARSIWEERKAIWGDDTVWSGAQAKDADVGGAAEEEEFKLENENNLGQLADSSPSELGASRKKLPERPIWILFGGEAVQGESTAQAAQEAAAAYHALIASDQEEMNGHDKNNQLRAFFLEPIDCGVQADQRRARVLEYRAEMKKAGAEEHELRQEAPTVAVSRIRDVPASARDPEQRGVWELSGVPGLLGATGAGLQHSCEALARPWILPDNDPAAADAFMRRRVRGEVTPREAAVSIARQELELAGHALFDSPRCYPWGWAGSSKDKTIVTIDEMNPPPSWSSAINSGGDTGTGKYDAAVQFLAKASPLIPRDPLPVPKYEFLYDWARAAGEAGAVAVLVLGRDPVVFGPLQAAMGEYKAAYTLSSAAAMRRTSDRGRMLRQLSGLELKGIHVPLFVEATVRELKDNAASEVTANEYLGRLREDLKVAQDDIICVRLSVPRLESMAEVVPLGTGRDLQILSMALEDGWDAIDPELLSAGDGSLLSNISNDPSSGASEGLRMPKVSADDGLVFEPLFPPASAASALLLPASLRRSRSEARQQQFDHTLTRALDDGIFYWPGGKDGWIRATAALAARPTGGMRCLGLAVAALETLEAKERPQPRVSQRAKRRLEELAVKHAQHAVGGDWDVTEDERTDDDDDDEEEREHAAGSELEPSSSPGQAKLLPTGKAPLLVCPPPKVCLPPTSGQRAIALLSHVAERLGLSGPTTITALIHYQSGDVRIESVDPVPDLHADGIFMRVAASSLGGQNTVPAKVWAHIANAAVADLTRWQRKLEAARK